MNFPFRPIAAAACLLAIFWAQADANEWSVASGLWSGAGNWSPAGPPQSDSATALVFGDSGNAYTSTNDLLGNTPFLLHSLTLTYTGGTGSVLDGAALQFAGDGAQLIQSQSGSFVLDLPCIIGGATLFGGEGSGAVTLNGPLSGAERIRVDALGIFRLGSPTNVIPSQNTFHGGFQISRGTLAFANDVVAGRTALRLNPIQFTSSAATLIATSELRCGELSGNSGSIVGLDPVTPFNGQNILLFTLGNTEFGGNLLTVPGANSTNSGTLTVRGPGVQSLAGTVAVDDSVIIGNGATLKLAKNASLKIRQNASVNLNGGQLILDNVAKKDNDRLRDRGVGQTSIDVVGGGTFSFLGHILGSAETLGQLQLGSRGQARSGALNVNVTDTSSRTAPTVLTFANYSRDSGDSPHSTVNFTATDAAGNVLALGRSGNNPRILFSQPPPLHNGLLAASDSAPEPISSGPNEHIGWATVNGRDFATYGVNGIAPIVSYPMPYQASGKYNAVLGASQIIAPSKSLALNSLKIAPTSSGQRLFIGGPGDLDTNAILLAGPRDFAVVNYGSAVGGIGGRGGSRYVFVQEAVLTFGVKIGTAEALTKAGAGTLVLSHPANSESLKALTINEGTVRATPGVSLPGGRIELRGGVLEITGGGTYAAALGIGPGNLNWRNDRVDPNTMLLAESQKDKGSGGFAAFGADATVLLTGSDLSTTLDWEEAYFLDSNHSLIFGSTRADHCLNFASNLNLLGGPGSKNTNYGFREVRVIDNPNSSRDFARMTGQITGPIYADLLKTGAGILDLSADNSGLLGGIVVAEGTVLTSHAQGLGAAAGAYILLGAHTGSACTALLANGNLTVARDIHVQSGSTGAAILGNATAPDAVTNAQDAVFSGRVTLGVAGINTDRTVELHAETGTRVVFTGGFNSVSGYLGRMDLEITGGGTVLLAGSNTYTGTTTVRSGVFQAAAAGVIPALSALKIGAGAQFNLNGFDQAVGSLAGDAGVLQLSTAVLTIGADASSTGFAGAIHGSGSVRKVGSGTLTLTGSNDYTGGTVLDGGVLVVNNSRDSATGSGGVQVNNTSTLQGAGTIAGAVSVNSGGRISPGTTVGPLTTGAATYAGGGIYRCELSDATEREGVGHDWHKITGALSLSATAASPFVIEVAGVHLGALAPVTHFDGHSDYGWIIASATGGIFGFDPAKFQIVSSDFTAGNPIGSGSFSVEQRDNNLVLVFTGTPFNGAGRYSGLISNPQPANDNSGFFRTTITNSGSFSGSLAYAGFRYALSGRFDANGDFVKTIASTNSGGALTVSLHLDTGNHQIIGSVSNTQHTSSLVAGRSLFHTTRNPAAQAGRYTLLLPAAPANSGPTYPQGDGYAFMRVTAAGLVAVTGKLADGTALTLGALLANDGSLPFYGALYAGTQRGSLSGTVQFQDLAAVSDCAGGVNWRRPAKSGAPYYPLGFSTTTQLIGSRFRAPVAGVRALDITTGSVAIGGGNLASEQVVGIALSTTNRLTVTDLANGMKLEVRIRPATGLLSGSFFDSARARTRTFTGVLFQKQAVGGGFFLVTDQSGYVRLANP